MLNSIWNNVFRIYRIQLAVCTARLYTMIILYSANLILSVYMSLLTTIAMKGFHESYSNPTEQSVSGEPTVRLIYTLT